MIFKEICQRCCFCCFIYKLLFLLNKFIHHIIKKKKKHNVSPEIYYIAPFFYRGLRIFVTPKESKKASVYAYQSMYWSRRLICLLYNYLLTTHSGIANKSWSMSPWGRGWLYSSIHNAWGCRLLDSQLWEPHMGDTVTDDMDRSHGNCWRFCDLYCPHSRSSTNQRHVTYTYINILIYIYRYNIYVGGFQNHSDVPEYNYMKGRDIWTPPLRRLLYVVSISGGPYQWGYHHRILDSITHLIGEVGCTCRLSLVRSMGWVLCFLWESAEVLAHINGQDSAVGVSVLPYRC